MMRKFPRLVAFGALSAALFGSATARQGTATDLRLDRCPTAAEVRAGDPSSSVQLAAAALGVQKRLLRVFASVPAVGQPFAFQMEEGFRLSSGPSTSSKMEPRDPPRFFRSASRICGPIVARRSWAFEIWIPTAPNVSQAGYWAFGVKARSGWRVYGTLQLN
jgi:hypothetical protein